MSHRALFTKSPTLSRNFGEKSTSRPRLSLTTPRVVESIFLNSSMYSSRLSNIRPEACTDPNSTDRLSSANWETCSVMGYSSRLFFWLRQPYLGFQPELCGYDCRLVEWVDGGFHLA